MLSQELCNLSPCFGVVNRPLFEHGHVKWINIILAVSVSCLLSYCAKCLISGVVVPA